MTLQLFRLLFDFGLLVLIWIIQLVVYPGFKYYRREELLEWHHRYTVQISYIVFPLMLGQLLVTGIQLWNKLSWYTLGSLLIIVLLWSSTFLQFVPLHNKISREDFNEKTIVQLVRKNWFRTALWTALFFMSLAFIA
jgi:DMSO reductase anchor subunit